MLGPKARTMCHWETDVQALTFGPTRAQIMRPANPWFEQPGDSYGFPVRTSERGRLIGNHKVNFWLNRSGDV